MALEHARPGQAIDVKPLGAGLGGSKTSTLIKTPHLEVIRVVLPKGKKIPPHKVAGEITVQCLEGRIAFRAGDGQTELAAGQMLYLEGGAAHALEGLEDASVLVTILLGG